MFALGLHRSILRLAGYAPVVVFAVGAVAVGLGSWLTMSAQETGVEEGGAMAQRALLEERMARGHERIEQLEVELPPEQERALRAEKLVAELKNLTGTWSWFGANRAQTRLNRERLKKMEALQADAVAKVTALQQELQRLRWEHEALGAERARLDTLIRAEEEKRASRWHAVREVWIAVRGWILIAAGTYLLATLAGQAGVRRWRSRRAAAV